MEAGKQADLADGSSDQEAPSPKGAAAPPPRVRGYEELDGGEGRGIFFRPHRFTAADLAPLRGVVVVVAGGLRWECRLRDISQNGVAFEWPEEEVVRPGQRLQIVVRFDSHAAFHGPAQVGSVREQDGGTVVGASFEGLLIDTDELLQLRDVRAWAANGSQLRLGAAAWQAPGHHRFKALVAELRLLLEHAEDAMRKLEQSLPWHVIQGPPSPPRSALVSVLHAEFGASIVRLAAEIDDALRSADEGSADALKEFSLRHVQQYLMQAPWMHRARNKPFGYPGDYEVMNFVYEKDFEGPTLFARAIGHAFLQTPPALAVRFRKDLMKRQLRAVLESRRGQGREVRVLSIAAGPARELQELLSEMDELSSPLEIVLFDQDKGALAHAYRRLRPVAEARFPGRVKIVYLNDSIKHLLRDPKLFADYGRFDAIYSCGLFDYLQEFTAVRLARSLCRTAAPGGHVFIANMVDHPGRWFMEHHLDWNLIYRTREELVAIGRRAMPAAPIRVLEEETGVNPFIELVCG